MGAALSRSELSQTRVTFSRMHIRFEGASAGEVTGSRHSVEVNVQGKACRFLVDCGMFQGGRDADEKNLQPFGVAPKDIQFVVLTHAHIDHSGLLPRLCAQGFKGPIYCTPATLDLLEVLLADSAHIQSGELARALDRKEKGKWRGELPEPLYSIDDVARCLSQVRTVPYRKPSLVAHGTTLEFVDAGHILGAASAVIDIAQADLATGKKTKRLVFSGDIGTRDRPVMNDPQRIESADVLVVESTYGDRLHRTLRETEDELVEVVNATLQRGGNVVMPAFAVGRTQEVIAILLALVRSKRLPFLSVFVDSPMATRASEITEQHEKILDPQTRELYQWARRNPDAIRVRYITEVNDSKTLNTIKSGAIILSASGMCEAGRIVHHLFWNLPRPQSAIVITGFQAAGTRGRSLVDGAKTLRLLGQEVPVRASIHTLGGLSAHGDQADLLWWCQGFRTPPGKVFITHGEIEPAENFAKVLQQELGWHAALPKRGEMFPC
jgi:metallo-beta-lactamase family protein